VLCVGNFYEGTNALERTALQYSRREPEEVRGEAAAMVEALKKLKESFAMTQGFKSTSRSL
jgi:hypothetical protein